MDAGAGAGTADLVTRFQETINETGQAMEAQRKFQSDLTTLQTEHQAKTSAEEIRRGLAGTMKTLVQGVVSSFR